MSAEDWICTPAEQDYEPVVKFTDWSSAHMSVFVVIALKKATWFSFSKALLPRKV